MERITYFIDWRPVASVAAVNPPVCSQIIVRRDISALLAGAGVKQDSDWHALTKAALESLRYRWRDDGIAVFELTFTDAFVEAVDEYYRETAGFQTERQFSDLLSSRGPQSLLPMVDRRVRPTVRISGRERRATTVQTTKADFEYALLSRLSSTASDVVKSQTGHCHCFNGPHARLSASSPIRSTKAVSLDHIFLRICPVPIQSKSFTDTEIDATPLADESKREAKADRTPFVALLHDVLLVKLMRSKRSGQERAAVFHLKRSFASLPDECLRVLPYLKEQHFLGNFPIPLRGWKVRWPMSLLVVFLLTTLLLVSPGLATWIFASITGNAELASAAFPHLSVGQRILVSFGWLTGWFLLYAWTEFAVRRRLVLDPLQRTAGVLDYGSVLGAILCRIAGEADIHRGGPAAPFEDKSSAILQRKLELEREKRDGNREMVAIVVAGFSLVFGIAAAFSWTTPSSEAARPSIQRASAEVGK